MDLKETILKAQDIYTFALEDEIKKDPQKVLAVLAIAELLLGAKKQKDHKKRTIKP